MKNYVSLVPQSGVPATVRSLRRYSAQSLECLEDSSGEDSFEVSGVHVKRKNRSWRILEASGRPLGASWSHLKASWRPLGAS